MSIFRRRKTIYISHKAYMCALYHVLVKKSSKNGIKSQRLHTLKTKELRILGENGGKLELLFLTMIYQ
jgi:hypothetical protein